MAHRITAIWDSKARVYSQAVVFANVPEAIRAFGVACSDANSPFRRWPGDYELHLVGEFDPESGKVTSVEWDTLAVPADFIEPK